MTEDVSVESSLMDRIAADIERQSWSVQTRALSSLSVRRILAAALEDQTQFKAAAIGRQRHLIPDIRSDEIHWVDSMKDSRLQEFSHLVEALRDRLNRHFLLNLKSFEGHFAHYRPGGRYQAHYDQPRPAKSILSTGGQRLISIVLYLNQDWSPSDGGELVIWDSPRQEKIQARIEPRAGTLAIFRSDSVFHEVLESKADRWSFTGWLRRE